MASERQSSSGGGQSEPDDELVVIGSGTVKVSSASFRGAEVGRFEMQLAVDVYDREGHLVGWYDVEMSAIAGGPGAGNRRGSLSFGVYEFDAILKGPPLLNRSQVFDAFHGQQVSISGAHLTAGPVGASVGRFRIGAYQDPLPIANTTGIGVGVGAQFGTVSVDQVRFRPRGF